MMYVVRKGYSYVDVNGRNKVYAAGEEFAGSVDPKQKWKLGEIKPEVELPMKQVKSATQTKKAKAETEIDPMDEGEEVD